MANTLKLNFFDMDFPFLADFTLRCINILFFLSVIFCGLAICTQRLNQWLPRTGLASIELNGVHWNALQHYFRYVVDLSALAFSTLGNSPKIGAIYGCAEESGHKKIGRALLEIALPAFYADYFVISRNLDGYLVAIDRFK